MLLLHGFVLLEIIASSGVSDVEFEQVNVGWDNEVLNSRFETKMVES